MVTSNNQGSAAGAVLLGFLAGSAITSTLAAICWRYQSRRQRGDDGAPKTTTKTIQIPDDLLQEQLSRHYLYFGDSGMKQLQSAKVLVVGLGGVGSHAAHMLARAGVGHLTLVDFDQVTLSSLNRHACATLADVGIPKVTCLKNYLHQIVPNTTIFSIVERYTWENGPDLLNKEDYDWVVDAIDDLPTKAALIGQAIAKGVRVVSCMGAGGKADVTRLHLTDLKAASRDPLATKLRQILQKAPHNWSSDHSGWDDMKTLTILFSSEKVVQKLAALTPEQEEEGAHQFGAVEGTRVRVLPVLGTMPAIMGQALSAYTLCELAGMPFQPVTGERVSRNVRNKLLQLLQRREVKLEKSLSSEPSSSGNNKTIWTGQVQIDLDDVEFLLELWRNRCAVTGDRLGTVLELVRWDLSKPSTCSNLVLMGRPALAKYDENGGKDSLPPCVQRVVEERLASVQQ